MTRRLILVFLMLSTLSVALAPPWLAWKEAQRQAFKEQAAWALGHAQAMLRRLDETVQQSLAGIAQLSHHADAPCSDDVRASMQRIVLSSPYIKAVGRVSNGSLQCSSLGTPSFSLGTNRLQASSGLVIYSNIPVDSNPSRLIAIEHNGFAVLFDSKLPLDVGSASHDTALAVLHLERRRDEPVSMARGVIDRAWLSHLGAREKVTFIEANNLVAVVRSANTPSAGVVALPLSYVYARRDAIAWRIVPAGLVAGIALAIALVLLARRQTSLAAALRHALGDDEFFLLYQPIVELHSGRWIGVEALLRWRRATGELIGPDLFIPIAEQTGMITRLTQRVLQLMEHDTRQFLSEHPDFHVALNLSAADMHSDAIVAWIDAILAHGSIKPSNLIVEITERGALDIQAALPVIAALRSRGIGVAIDDFGTGYAGLSYLEALHMDYLKIDRSFIEAIGTSAPTNEVVSHIISMAAAMKLMMVAEGIETQAQADYLRSRSVQFAQGWLFAKPQRFADIAARMQST